MNSFDNTANNYLSFLRNDYVRAGLGIFLIVYASLAAPQLPSYLERLFDYNWFRFIIFFLIAYLLTNSAAIALIAALIVFVILLILERTSLNENMIDLQKFKLTDAQRAQLAEGRKLMEEGKQLVEDGVVLVKDGNIEDGKQIIAEGKKLLKQGFNTIKTVRTGTSEALIEDGQELVDDGYVEEGEVMIDDGQLYAEQEIMNGVNGGVNGGEDDLEVVENILASAQENPNDIVIDPIENMSDEASINSEATQVIEEVKKYEAVTGKKITRPELREICQRVHQDCAFKRPHAPGYTSSYYDQEEVDNFPVPYDDNVYAGVPN